MANLTDALPPKSIWTAFMTMSFIVGTVALVSWLNTSDSIAQTALIAIAGAGGVDIWQRAKVDRADREFGRRKTVTEKTVTEQ